MGPWESTPSTSIIEHPVGCTGRDCSWVHGRTPHPRAPTSTLCAAASRNRTWAHGRAPHPRAYTSTLCTAQAGIAHGPMGEHPVHEHPRAPCALHRHGSLMGPWESAPSKSIHEHPVRCTCRNRSWTHGRALHPRTYTSILRAAHVGAAHGSMGEHPVHEHPLASWALHR